jgi:diadenosine tetraphosphatase ApaH/serine/threonine PP2A family protein phosphatase
VAVFADPHANGPAIRALARALREDAADRVVCLGDIVGYNADPVEVVDWVHETCTDVVMGNHDHDAIKAPVVPGTNAAARIAQEWTKSVLRADQVEYLAALPNVCLVSGALVAVHGCYMNDVHYSGYVTGTMLGPNLERVAKSTRFPKVAFCGHTHQPMCGWLYRGEVFEVKAQGTVRIPSAADAALVNPGAIGQPRDGDPRAAYVLFDSVSREVTFRRVAYDVEAAQRSVLAAGLPGDLAERLAEGR